MVKRILALKVDGLKKPSRSVARFEVFLGGHHNLFDQIIIVL